MIPCLRTTHSLNVTAHLKKIETDILPLAISILLVLISFGITMTLDYIFTTKHYVGIGSLMASCILYFINRKVYYWFFALTLTIGLLGYLDFYLTSFKVGFAKVGVNPIFLGLMILLFAVSKNKMDKLYSENKGQKPRVLDENLIKSFEIRFKDKTVTELNAIMDNNSKFTNEAKTAAKSLLEKKNVL